MSRGRSLGRALLLGSVFGFVAANAAAQGPGSAGAAQVSAAAELAAVEADAAALNEQGLALYAAHDYRHALEKFLGAHALENDPGLLFNIARCYEQLGELDAALEKYELFVATADGKAAGLARARASLVELEGARRVSASAARSSTSESPGARRPKEPASSSAFGADEWRWLTLGSSAALVAVGATVYALGARDHARITDLPEYGKSDAPAGMTWRQANALVHSGDTKKLVGGISLGLGGALAATALALFLSADRAGQEEATLAVQPSVLRGGGALLLAGTFR
jgi:tetratricopeptide (TPR) repeat protein